MGTSGFEVGNQSQHKGSNEDIEEQPSDDLQDHPGSENGTDASGYLDPQGLVIEPGPEGGVDSHQHG